MSRDTGRWQKIVAMRFLENARNKLDINFTLYVFLVNSTTNIALGKSHIRILNNC